MKPLVVAAAALALVLASAGSAATSASEPIYPMVSPDGTHIAWIEGSNYQLWTAYPNGTNPRPLGANFAADGVSFAAWTESGIVVDSDYALFLVTVDGKRTRLGPDDDFTFSVGGYHVASGSGSQPGQTGPVRVVDLRTRRTVTMGFPHVANVEPTLSPDGSKVAWLASGSLWVAPVGGKPRRLVRSGDCPQWSPNGRTVMYFASRKSRVAVVPAVGGKPRILQVEGGCNVPGGPVWSPDSTRIATGANGLTVVNVDTDTSIHVAHAFGDVAGGFAWAPDRRTVYASARPWKDASAGSDCTSLWRLDAATLSGSVVVRGCP